MLTSLKGDPVFANAILSPEKRSIRAGPTAALHLVLRMIPLDTWGIYSFVRPPWRMSCVVHAVDLCVQPAQHSRPSGGLPAQITAHISAAAEAGLVDPIEAVDALGYLLLNYRSHPRDAGVLMPMLQQRWDGSKQGGELRPRAAAISCDDLHSHCLCMPPELEVCSWLP